MAVAAAKGDVVISSSHQQHLPWLMLAPEPNQKSSLRGFYSIVKGETRRVARARIVAHLSESKHFPNQAWTPYLVVSRGKLLVVFRLHKCGKENGDGDDDEGEGEGEGIYFTNAWHHGQGGGKDTGMYNITDKTVQPYYEEKCPSLRMFDQKMWVEQAVPS